MEQLSSKKECLVIGKSETRAQVPLNASSSLSSPRPLKNQTMIEKDNVSTFISINADNMGNGAVRLPVQKMKNLKDFEDCKMFKPQVCAPSASSFKNNFFSSSKITKDNPNSQKDVLTPSLMFEKSQKNDELATMPKLNNPWQQNSSAQFAKYRLKPMPTVSFSNGQFSTQKSWDIFAISANALMPELRDHIENIYSHSKPISSLNLIEPFKALTIMVAKTSRLLLNHKQEDGFEELKTKVFELIASKLPDSVMEQYEKLHSKQSLRKMLGFLCNFVQDKMLNVYNGQEHLCFKCFKRGHMLSKCRGLPMLNSLWFDFEANNYVESDDDEEEDESDEDDDEECDDEGDEEDDEEDEEYEKQFYEPIFTSLPPKKVSIKPIVSETPDSTAELKLDASGFYNFTS